MKKKTFWRTLAAICAGAAAAQAHKSAMDAAFKPLDELGRGAGCSPYGEDYEANLRAMGRASGVDC